MINNFDIHTHILPNVDDGSKDLETSLKMIEMAYNDGTRNIVCTPHYNFKMDYNVDKLRKIFEKLKSEVNKRYNDIFLYLGTEILYDSDVAEKLFNRQILTINDTNYCLVEFPVNISCSYIFSAISSITTYGFIPIIAHIERYLCLYKDEEVIQNFKKMGAMLQINSNSVLGNNGYRAKKFCKRVLKYHYADFIASDAHDIKNRVPLLSKCRDYVLKKYGIDYTEQLFMNNGILVVNN